MTDTPRYDVIVLGGGPAGCAAAMTLVRHGFAVTVLERARHDSFRVGETLAPRTQLLLENLGAWEALQASGPIPSPGVVSLWGSADPYEHDFLGGIYDTGWHVDRAQFDALLVRSGEQLGVYFVRCTSSTQCRHDEAGVWTVAIHRAGELVQIQGRFLIDATGRAAWLATRQGAKRRPVDQLVGVAGMAVAADSGPWEDQDRRLLVEAVEDGWWYTSPMPGGPAIAVFLTDADLLPKTELERTTWWEAAIAQTTATRTRLRGTCWVEGIRVVQANCAGLDRVVGDDWLAVGDAAVAWDPLAGQGVYRALESGQHGGECAAAHLAGDRQALTHYITFAQRTWQSLLASRHQIYDPERRWSSSTFWKRRHSKPADGLS